jgi:tetratricopeptide (TPR) repeat protein
MSLFPAGLASQETNEQIYDRFERVSSLRSQGQYDKAIEVLQEIIAEYSKSDEVLRRAYCDLVFTLMSKPDPEGATQSAREALLRFPDLTADPVYFPPRVNELYDQLRNELYGALHVQSKPDSCRVFLGEQFVGVSPLHLEYVRVGDYAMNLSKSGYKDEASPLRIEPGSPTSVQLSLQRERDKKWWLWRVGPGVALAGVLVYLGLSGEEAAAAAEPLPGPPSPPTQ